MFTASDHAEIRCLCDSGLARAQDQNKGPSRRSPPLRSCSPPRSISRGADHISLARRTVLSSIQLRISFLPSVGAVQELRHPCLVRVVTCGRCRSNRVVSVRNAFQTTRHLQLTVVLFEHSIALQLMLPPGCLSEQQNPKGRSARPQIRLDRGLSVPEVRAANEDSSSTSQMLYNPKRKRRPATSKYRYPSALAWLPRVG